jgi:hypothetical protein
VAVNFGLITSSTILGKLSNTLLVQGEKLTADDILLLEKDLGLENKIAFHLLFNEKVLSAGKRRFLGSSMKMASPFVARGTSIFFAANLIDDIKKGNKEGIISNGAIVSVDAAEAGIEGLEYLDLITEVSAVTGPTGEAISVLVWLGTDAYHAEQQVEKIKDNVHLSRTETLIQSARALFHLDPSEYLTVKSNNNQLVQGAIDFLKVHTAIRYSIFSSFRSETSIHENNQIFLDGKRELMINDESPDDPSEGKLFCLSGSLTNAEVNKEDILSIPSFLTDSSFSVNSQTIDKIIYLCQNALGVEYAINRTDNLSFINLGQGNDTIIAFIFSPTLFLVEGGKKNFQGSYKEDLFILVGDSSITGLLKGTDGSDTLSFSNFYPKKTDYLLLDINGFLCEKNNSASLYLQLICHHPENSLELNGINQFVGRKNQREVIYVGPETHSIDGYGGLSKDHPDNFFITSQSYENPKLVLRNNTVVTFFSNTNTKSVDYRIPIEEMGKASLEFNFMGNCQHRFFFDCSIEDIIEFTINATQLTLVTQAFNSSEKVFNLWITNSFYSEREKRNSTENITKLLTNISYFFQGLALRLVNSKHIYIQEIEEVSKQTIDERIDAFTKLVNRLGRAFSVQLMDNRTISIGQGKHEIFYTHALSESHLVGNGGENVYVFLPGNHTLFPLPEIILYDIFKEDLHDDLTEEWGDTLDLRAIAKKVKQICPVMQEISTEILPMENDLVLKLSIPFYFRANRCVSLDSFWHLATIRLRHALLNNWYQKLDIFLQNAVPRNIFFTENETWVLQEIPLVFTSNKNIIVITVNDIGRESEILLLKNAENYSFFRNKMDLILTNALDNPVDYWTIICRQFYEIPEMREKILSVNFRFFEKVIHPQDHQEEINQAPNFSAVLPIETTDSPLNIPSTLSPLLIRQGLDHQLSRSRRQIDQESHITRTDIKQISNKAFELSHRKRLLKETAQNKQIIEEERILIDADNYLKNHDADQSKHQRPSHRKKLSHKNKIEQSRNSVNSVKTEKNSQSTKKISLIKRDIFSHLAQKAPSSTKPRNENLLGITGKLFSKTE